jgi:hypothetical protein
MGGDDLDNDDGYLVQEVKDTAVDELVREVEKDSKQRKRKQEVPSSVSNEPSEDQRPNDSTSNNSSSSSKRKKSKSCPEALLLDASRNLETTEQQAAFLSASLRHYSLVSTNTDPEISLDHAAHFVAASNNNNTASASLVELLKNGISSKQLKKAAKSKDNTQSPAVVIICQSARRAVAILKECSVLNTRVAKLFPKNGTVEQQLAQLRTAAAGGSSSGGYGLAVGTPHRLQQLCQAVNGLSFAKTRLVVLDCHASPKGFTVCTLPDTAPDTMSLLRDFVVPQLQRRKGDLRLAFF